MKANSVASRRTKASTFDATKTRSRDVPLFDGADAAGMLLNWRERRPRLDSEVFRVSPCCAASQPWPRPRKGGGGPLLYSNYRTRNWKPFLRRLELPEATPHSARHSFISMLQAAGIAVATVVKFDGHANPVTTLNVYSNAVRGSEAAAKVLGVCMWEDEESLGLDLDVELACFPQGFSALYGREKSDRPGTGEQQHMRDIRRATRRKWSSEEKSGSSCPVCAANTRLPSFAGVRESQTGFTTAGRKNSWKQARSVWRGIRSCPSVLQ